MAYSISDAAYTELATVAAELAASAVSPGSDTREYVGHLKDRPRWYAVHQSERIQAVVDAAEVI